MNERVQQAVRIATLRKALQRIADLPLHDHPTFKHKPNPRVTARKIAVAALKATR